MKYILTLKKVNKKLLSVYALTFMIKRRVVLPVMPFNLDTLSAIL